MQIMGNIVGNKSMPTAKLLIVCSWFLLFGGIAASIYNYQNCLLSAIGFSFASMVGALLLRMIATVGESLLSISFQAAHIRENTEILKETASTLKEIKHTLQDVSQFFEELKQKIDIAD